MGGKTACDVKAARRDAQHGNGQPLHTFNQGKPLLVQPCRIGFDHIAGHAVPDLSQGRLQHARIMAIIRIFNQKAQYCQAAVFDNDISGGAHLPSRRSRINSSV